MKTFVTVWAGQVVSQVGSAMVSFALAIYVFQISGSATQLSMVLLAASVPGLLITPIAGAWVDRLDRRIVMAVADSIAGLGSVTLLVVAQQKELTLGPIVAVALILSLAGAFQEPAYRASIVTLVPQENLGRANGMIEMGPAMGTLFAPALAGAILLTAGIEAVLLIDVITFLVAVIALAAVRFPQLKRSDRAVPTRLWTEIMEGMAYLRERGALLGLLTMTALLNFFLSFVNLLWLPVFLGFANEAQVGLIMTFAGVGMLIGSVTMSAWGGPQRLLPTMIGIMIVGGLTLSLTGARPSIWITGVAMFGFMFFTPLVNGISQTLWQRKVDAKIQGRVFSTRRMIGSIAAPLGLLIAGPLADGVFEPLLVESGALVDSVGQIVGVGVGRGSGLLVIIAGFGVSLTALIAWLVPTVRNIETGIPDAVVDLA
ncbi:MAG: MFS transporter [Acidimicrobiia bacterium]|nr:MFS transporter [Acidimicrobiia bacterium]MDH5503343.1 MFS transporter [Acidimicrobiia bacterium]